MQDFANTKEYSCNWNTTEEYQESHKDKKKISIWNWAQVYTMENYDNLVAKSILALL